MTNPSTSAHNALMEVTVLTGKHVGARQPLPVGSYLIGNAVHCDIVVAEASVSPEHVLVTVANGSVNAHALGPNVTINESNIDPGKSARLSAATVLAISEIEFGFNAPGSHWENEPGLLDGTQPDTSATHSSRSWPMIAGIGALCTAALFGVGIVAASVLQSNQLPQPISIEQRHHDLNLRVGKLEMPELYVLRSDNDTLQVHGYVRSQNQLQRLKAATVDLDPQITVFAADELVRYASDYVRGKSLEADVTYVKAGVLHLQGQDDANGSLQKLATTMVGEIPGVTKVLNNITPFAAIPPKPIPPTPEEEHFITGIAQVNSGHTIRYLVIGENHVFEGGVLDSGWKVVSIGDEHVVLEHRGERKKIEVFVR